MGIIRILFVVHLDTVQRCEKWFNRFIRRNIFINCIDLLPEQTLYDCLIFLNFVGWKPLTPVDRQFLKLTAIVGELFNKLMGSINADIFVSMDYYNIWKSKL